MKKVISIIVALMLIMSSSLAFASNGKGNQGNDKGNKYGSKFDYSKELKKLKDMLKKYFANDEKRDEIIGDILDLKDKYDDDSTSIFINGIEYSSNDGPVIKYGNFQLPTKPITQGLGASLNWNANTKTITVKKGNITLVMILDKKIVRINGVEVKNSILTNTKKNKTIVLIKYIAQVLGKSAEIDDDSNAVVIENDGSTSINDSITGTGANQFEYKGNWKYGEQSGAFLEDNHWSSTKDAYYNVKFSGTQIKLYGAAAPTHGIAAVSIDGGAEADVSFYASSRADNVLLYTSPILSQGQHVLKVRVKGTGTDGVNNAITADRVNIAANASVPDTTNLALNKNSFSDSVQQDNTTAKGNDGNASTRWSAADGAFNHWWTVDLGNYYNISGSEVTWEQSNKIYKYKVDVSADNSNWTNKVDKTNNSIAIQTQRDSFTANGVRFVRVTVTGMESGCWASFYEFKVFGANTVSDTQVPSVPSGLVAAASEVNEVTLNWNASSDNVGVTGYKVFRNGTQVGTVTNGISYRDTGLSASTPYVYAVSSFDAAGNNSNQCVPVVVTTPSVDTQAPTAPATVTATVSSNTQVIVSWTASTDNNRVAGYKIYRNGSYITSVTNALTYIDSGLTAGTVYFYTVAAYDGSNNLSAQSTPVVATTPSASDTQAPSVPTNLTGTATSISQILLTWTASTDNVGVTGYKVFRNGSQIATVSSATVYTDTGLTANSPYVYAVLAFDAFGNSSAQCLPVVVFTPQSNTNIALNKTVSTDSQEAANYAARGNDGNASTRWSAADGSFNHWWKVDLGKLCNITGTEVTWEFAKNYKYKVEVSQDDVNWTLALNKTDNTSSQQTQTESFTANNARYVRVTVTSFGSGCWASFYEFKVFGN
jgi:chitodextrinase